MKKFEDITDEEKVEAFDSIYEMCYQTFESMKEFGDLSVDADMFLEDILDEVLSLEREDWL